VKLISLSLVALAVAAAAPSAASAQTFSKMGQIPQFLAPVSYPVPGATLAVLADVNGDGILDIVTANGFPGNTFVAGGQGVSVLLGNGDGSFQPAHHTLATGNPTSVVVGDFNKDGKPDIVVAYGPGVATLSILHGNGDGTFQAPATIPIGYFANVTGANNLGVSSLLAGDFNGDGKLDLALASSSIIANPAPGTGGSPFFDVYNLEILVNRGDGTFATTDTPVSGLSAAGVPSPLIVADFDGDGKPDLVSSDGTVLLSNGNGTFRTVPTSAGTVHASGAIGDFNGDGRLDMAGFGPGGGNRGHIFPPPASVMSFGLPGGNFGPAFVSNFITSVVTITNNGLTTNVTFNGDNFIAADFNGDGKLDFAGFRDLSYGTGDGQFNPTFNTYDFVSALHFQGFAGEFTPPLLVAAGDLDRDGAPDLIALGDGNSVQVALNAGGPAPKLAQFGLLDSPALTQISKAVVGGGAPSITGEVALGSPAPTGGAVVNLASSSPVISFPGGTRLVIPAGSQLADFKVSTTAVAVPTTVTISANVHFVTLKSSLIVVPPFSLASLSPVAVLGTFGGNAGKGTVTLSGPAADGVVVHLVSANPAVLTVPASIAVAPGATTATFSMTANHVDANTVVNVTGTLGTTSRIGAVTVTSQSATVVVQKAEYVVKKGQLTVQATSTNLAAFPGELVPSLRVYNASTGTLIGLIRVAGINKGIGTFTGGFNITGSLTSIAVQDSGGGVAVAAVAQK
jgi:FG-GAP-like repeat